MLSLKRYPGEKPDITGGTARKMHAWLELRGITFPAIEQGWLFAFLLFYLLASLMFFRALSLRSVPERITVTSQNLYEVMYAEAKKFQALHVALFTIGLLLLFLSGTQNFFKKPVLWTPTIGARYRRSK